MQAPTTEAMSQEKTTGVAASSGTSPLAALTTSKKRIYQPRCQQCRGCTAADCGECVHCKAKTKFGGPGGTYRYCIKRKCEAQTQRKNPKPPGATRPPQHVAGESNDEELPFTRLPLADENGIKTEAPTLEKQQGYSSLSAASLADTATGVQGGPKESDARESSDDELPIANLTLTDKEENEDSAPGKLQRNPSPMSGTPATEAKSGPKVAGSSYAELLQPLVQEMERGNLKVTELKVKEAELSRLRQTEREMSLQLAQQTAKFQNQEAKIAHLQTSTQQHEQKLQEEVTRLRIASKKYEQQLREKDDEISRIQSTALQKAIEVQEQLNSAARVQQELQQSHENAQLRERSAQLQTAFDQQVKTLIKKEQKIAQLEETVKQHKELEEQREQLGRQQAKVLLQKEHKIAQLEETAKQHKEIEEQREQLGRQQAKVLLQKEHKIAQLEEAISQQFQRMQQLEADGKQQVKKLQEKEREIARLREQSFRSAQLMQAVEQQLKTLQEQEGKMKEWLTSIPMHGVQITNLPS